jgi:hypothetical protein
VRLIASDPVNSKTAFSDFTVSILNNPVTFVNTIPD